MMKGIFITFEGIDGCGKSTQCEMLKDYLKESGKDFIFVREPGGPVIGERIREILLDKKNSQMTARTELLLFEAARAQITEEVIKPAIQQANEAGIHAFGPFPADGFFGARAYEHFDGILAMYHDQGLAPFKLIAQGDGVNYTAGLDIVRTSPAHGTAFDIAGQGVADENSFRQAIYAAIDVHRARQAWDAAHANPLPKLYVDKRDKSEKG